MNKFTKICSLESKLFYDNRNTTITIITFYGVVLKFVALILTAQ